jgi:alpha-tubulin suppressor-like RCC1 family protein
MPALAASGGAWCWGGSLRGQLGNGGMTPDQSATPVAVTGNLTFGSLNAGGIHTCGVTTGGVAYCWGSGMLYQLGNGSYLDQPAPVQVYGQ